MAKESNRTRCIRLRSESHLNVRYGGSGKPMDTLRGIVRSIPGGLRTIPEAVATTAANVVVTAVETIKKPFQTEKTPTSKGRDFGNFQSARGCRKFFVHIECSYV